MRVDEVCERRGKLDGMLAFALRQPLHGAAVKSHPVQVGVVDPGTLPVGREVHPAVFPVDLPHLQNGELAPGQLTLETPVVAVQIEVIPAVPGRLPEKAVAVRQGRKTGVAEGDDIVLDLDERFRRLGEESPHRPVQGVRRHDVHRLEIPGKPGEQRFRRVGQPAEQAEIAVFRIHVDGDSLSRQDVQDVRPHMIEVTSGCGEGPRDGAFDGFHVAQFPLAGQFRAVGEGREELQAVRRPGGERHIDNRNAGPEGKARALHVPGIVEGTVRGERVRAAVRRRAQGHVVVDQGGVPLAVRGQHLRRRHRHPEIAAAREGARPHVGGDRCRGRGLFLDLVGRQIQAEPAPFQGEGRRGAIGSQLEGLEGHPGIGRFVAERPGDGGAQARHIEQRLLRVGGGINAPDHPVGRSALRIPEARAVGEPVGLDGGALHQRGKIEILLEHRLPAVRRRGHARQRDQ